MLNLKVSWADSHLSWLILRNLFNTWVQGIRGLAVHTRFEDKEISLLELLYFKSIDDRVHHGVSVRQQDAQVHHHLGHVTIKVDDTVDDGQRQPGQSKQEENQEQGLGRLELPSIKCTCFFGV